MTETTTKPTREDVEKLKRDWLNDPIWDIEETPGFESYRAELTEFAEEQHKRWEAAAEKRRAAFEAEAEGLGLTPDALHLIRRLEERVAALEPQ